MPDLKRRAVVKKRKKGEHYRIIPPSYEILHWLDEQDIPRRIEWCGRICYKTEEQMTAESSEIFGNKIVQEKHNSVLEMAVVTHEVSNVDDVYIAEMDHVSKHVIIDVVADGAYLITASIRVIREMYMLHPHNCVIHAIARDVAQIYPIYFSDLRIPAHDVEIVSAPTVVKVTLKYLDDVLQFESPAVWRRHRFLAVKFVVNRAVTHELVRHRPCAILQESQRYCNYGSKRFSGMVTLIKPIFFAENTSEYRRWERSVAASAWDYLTLLKTSSPQAARTVLPNSCKTEIIVFANIVQWNHILHMRTSPAAEPSMREVMVPLQEELRIAFRDETFDQRSPEAYLVTVEDDTN